MTCHLWIWGVVEMCFVFWFLVRSPGRMLCVWSMSCIHEKGWLFCGSMLPSWCWWKLSRIPGNTDRGWETEWKRKLDFSGFVIYFIGIPWLVKWYIKHRAVIKHSFDAHYGGWLKIMLWLYSFFFTRQELLEAFVIESITGVIKTFLVADLEDVKNKYFKIV